MGNLLLTAFIVLFIAGIARADSSGFLSPTAAAPSASPPVSPLQTISIGSGEATKIAISPDKQWVACLWTSQFTDPAVEIRVYAISTGKVIGRWSEQVPAQATRRNFQDESSLAFSPDSKELLYGGPSGVLRAYDPDGTRVGIFPPQPGSVSSLSFAPNGWIVTLLSVDAKGASVWNYGLRKEIFRVNHVGAKGLPPLWTGVMKPNGTLFALLSRNGIVRVFNPQTGKEVPRGGGPYFYRVPKATSALRRDSTQIIFGPNGELRVAQTGSLVFTYYVFMVDDTGFLGEVQLPFIPPIGIHRASFSQTGETLFASPESIYRAGSCAQVVHLSGLNPVISTAVSDPGITSVSSALSLDGTLAATGDVFGNVYLWGVP